MAISEKLKVEIEQEILGLTVIKRPGCGHTDFMTEFSRILAQTNIDKIPLENAKFDFTKIEKFEAYLEILSYAMSDKGVSFGVKGNAQADLEEMMKTVTEKRKVLLKFVKFIFEETQSSEVRQAYEYIKKGYGDIDSANDCILMVSFARKNMDYANKIAPIGQEINEQLLQAVESAAVAVLKGKGVSIATSSDSTKLVERQDRIISLCCDALIYIRRYADKAFEQEYYDQYYADRVKRAQKQSSAAAPKEELEPEAVS
jgi:hypothetical protein